TIVFSLREVPEYRHARARCPCHDGRRHVSVLCAQLDAVESAMPYAVTGQVAAISGLTIEASDLALPMGALCRITSLGGKISTAEVIGFDNDRTLLMALSSIAGVARGDKIEN